MKKLMSILWLTCGLLLTACSSDDEVNNVQPNDMPETVEISLSMSGDVITTSDSPITRASETKKKIYGINVYYREGNDGDYNYYAYGLFDNVADMKISLISKYNYKFECTIVQDDADKLYYSEADGRIQYSYPFVSNWNNTNLLNKFIVSTTSSIHLEYIKSGRTSVLLGIGSRIRDYPATDRLYGELSGYVPQTNGTATIPMKRTAFGAKFVINPPADGTLNVRCDEFFSVDVAAGGEANTIAESLYAFSDVYSCWQQTEDYTQNFTVYLTWKRSNGATQTFSQNVTMKRNVMTTVNVNVNGSTNDSTIGFTEDSNPTTGSTVNINFNGGSEDDNNVNPN